MIKRLFLFLVLSSIGFNSVTADDTYVKVTSTSDLVVGGTYILAATKSGTTYVVTSFDTSIKQLKTISSTSSGFSVDGNIINIDTATPLVFTLGGTSSGYTLKYGASPYYLGYNSSTSLRQSDTDANNKEKWTYVYNDTYGSFLLTNVGDVNRMIIGNTYGTGSSAYYAFRANTTTALGYGLAPANLYRKVSTLTLADACTDGEKFYGTYSNETSFVVPSDLTVSEIKVSADGKLTVGNYSTGDVVPANTGVMVSSSTAGDHSVTLTSAAGSSIFGSENMLKPSGNGITAEAMAEANGGCKYYRLTMHNGTTLGYYWGAADGAAFALGANKAYLAVPTGIGARLTGFDMADGEATGIGAALNDRGEMKNNEPIYDLQGRRMANSQLRKGLYIVNGKKHIIK